MKNIYLDHAAWLPVDTRVLKFAEGFLKNGVGNPSALYSFGLAGKKVIEEAREKVAKLINAESENCIVFTSGATESNNLAIKGTALRNIKKGKKLTASSI